ncbi:transposase [Donghicola sp.]|uniref:transposase n=1 Tax=Donghicola sp. TaxID=1929294 RepID=UPI0025E825F3|nr:transposase [Donghicola sp.]MCT4576153.1 transposase [Donghicola sp.]
MKAELALESYRDGVSLADFARKRGISAPQLHSWRRAAREGGLAMPDDDILGWCLLSLKGMTATPVLPVGTKAMVLYWKSKAFGSWCQQDWPPTILVVFCLPFGLPHDPAWRGVPGLSGTATGRLPKGACGFGAGGPNGTGT